MKVADVISIKDIWKQSFRYFSANVGFIIMLILPPALLMGLVAGVCKKMYIIYKMPFPFLGQYLGSWGSATLVIKLSGLILIVFWLGALLYFIDRVVQVNIAARSGMPGAMLYSGASVTGERLVSYAEVFKQGAVNWGKLFQPVLTVFLIAQGPAYLGVILGAASGWLFNVLIIWSVLVIIFYLWKYVLVFPVIMFKKYHYSLAMEIAAIYSEQLRAKIMLIIAPLILLAYVGFLSGLFLMEYISASLSIDIYSRLILQSTGGYLIFWVLLSITGIAVYLIYRQETDGMEAASKSLDGPQRPGFHS